MKKLIYIDNSTNQEEIKKTVSFYAYQTLFGNVDESLKKQLKRSDIEIISGFGRLDRDKQIDALFREDQIILTWSVYSRGFDGDSKAQLEKFLKSAGRNDIRDRVYMDLSGEIIEALSSSVISKDIDLLCGISNNFIITKPQDSRSKGFSRIIIDLSAGKYDCIKTRELDSEEISELFLLKK